MQPTRVRGLLAIAAVFGVVGYLLFRWVYTDLPTLPSYSPVSLGLLAIANGYLALAVRERSERRRLKVAPLIAARYVALAKASSVLGSGFLGIYLGMLGFLVSDLDKPQLRHDARTAAIGAAAALLLVAGALWLEKVCRIPRPPADDDELAAA